MSVDDERRLFLKVASAAACGSLLPAGAANAVSGDRWTRIAGEFMQSPTLLNLNNAGVSPQPRCVRESMVRAYRFSNELPDVHMWEVLDGSRDRTKQKLAELVDCAADEIALNRNATEGLCTVIYGIELQAGDEVVLSEWDYDSVRQAWELRAKRSGLRISYARFDVMASDEEVLEAYRRAITPRTRMIHLTQTLHYTGRVLPVRSLCALARRHGALSMVDAAQSFAQLPVSFRELDCDYLAASLHKWLCAPFGTGMLVVKRARIERLWPLLAPYDAQSQGIARLDGSSLGTYCSAAEHAIETAIDFHNQIGTAAIHERLRTLTRYWAERASDIAGLSLQTPLDDPNTGAVALFSLQKMSPEQVEKTLRLDHGIRVRARRHGGLAGVRVSPHIYTQLEDLDRFVAALRSVTRA